ncbi:MAG: hypothetical protein U9O20_00850 [Patescibacteria group bacterium]|nr:hypothetical protein [Patescibacteria group bacterium]
MRKTLIRISLLIVAVTAVGFVVSQSFADDTDPIEISVNGQKPWTETFTWDNIEPGNNFEIELEITNTGVTPVKLWKIIKCVEYNENEIIEPEQEWYDEHPDQSPKNDLDSAIVYEMYVDGQLAISKKAGITMDQIKDNYMGLVKLDQPFAPSNGDGMLHPGNSVTVIQRYYMHEDTENWAQSDAMTFVMEIEARQINAPEPLQQMSFIDNKYPGWNATADERMGILKYDYMSPELNYDFLGVGLNPTKEYCLIYAKDPWGAAKPLIDSGTTDGDGKINLIGSKSLGNLPSTDDTNYPNGAKIWLLPCNEYTGSIGWPPHDDWLFDNWPGLINYRQGERPNEEISCDFPAPPDPPTIESVEINRVLSSSDWTGDARNYSLADVIFSYLTPTSEVLMGTLTAEGLKPYTTYQMKFIGKPACDGGDDVANEYIGYEGRWTVLNIPCTGAGCNRTDAQYEANRAKADTDPTKECIAGYLVWDFFTTDAGGDAMKVAVTDSSYHVLWCNGGTCGVANNSQLKYEPEAGLNYHYCDAGDVEGQIERGYCGGLVLDPATYDLKIVLTEESFHQAEGTWTSVLEGDINFKIE